MKTVSELFGSMVFNDEAMKERLPEEVYNSLQNTIQNGKHLDLSVANVVANAMKDWAIEKGATHYTHWFQPMTGITAEKHDSFISPIDNANVIMEFKGKELDASTRELLTPWQIPTTVPGNSIMRTLRHCITGGYSAGYYSYKWAEVLAADAFTRFTEEGVMNRSTGEDFRNEILSKGDSSSAAELYRNFMGREPNPDALLQVQGLCD